MKTWAWVVVAVVGAFFIYRGFFAPEPVDETETTDEETPRVLEVAKTEEPAPTDREATPSPRIDLRGEGGEPSDVLPAADAAAVELGKQWRQARRASKSELASQLANRLLREHPESDAARWVHYERGRDQLQKYRRLGRSPKGLQAAQLAWRELTPALFLRDISEVERKELRTTLRGLAKELLFRRHVEGVDRLYTPKSGDNLTRLCRKVFARWGGKVSPGFVASVNGMRSPRDLRAKEPIRVPLGESRIVVVKSEFRLYFLHNGGYVRDYPVGLGKEGSTPEATFVIDNKLRNPDWYPTAGVKIPYGDPRNILGTRWLGFKNTAEYRGFGIHGTSQPSSIGKSESSGCVRLLRRDVEQIFEWAPEGTTVVIRR